jgi:pyruvate dehydrogenase E2 component (dihydrolipoamide acetyltransferase)
MAKVLGLPKLSPTMEEGTLVRWAKKEGDTVEVDDLIAEVETDKATMEFRAFDKGVLLKLLVAEGASLKPDEPVAILGRAGESVTDVQVGSAVPAAAAPAAQASAAPAPSAPATNGKHTDVIATTPGRVLASPLVRRMARERDVDLTSVSGSGPKGRIVLRDLESQVPAQAPVQAKAPAPVQAPAPSAQAEGSRLVPLNGMRKTIAARLTQSKRDIPHFYLSVDIEASALEAMRKQVNEALTAEEKVSINDFILKACASALKRVPNCNASFEGEHIRYFEHADISVAVSVPDGLVTPVLRNAEQKSIAQISREVRELAAKAKEKKLKPEDMAGGTFSVSNLGMFGIDEFAAVIRPPEAAILAVGAIRDVPVVKGGAVVPGRMMSLTLSCDHRVIDGALGAELLKQIRTLLEKPLALLAL